MWLQLDASRHTGPVRRRLAASDCTRNRPRGKRGRRRCERRRRFSDPDDCHAGQVSERLRIFRAVMADPTLRRVELAYLGFHMTEFAAWIAILVYAFEC